MTMFDRYTDRARRSVVLAQDEARRLGHAAVDVDHLLLGLAAEGEGTAAQALDRAREGLDAVCVRAALLKGKPLATASIGHIAFTREAKRALDQALRESLKLGHNFIGGEHLLLGVVSDCEACPDSPCAAVLKACAVTPEAVREAVMTLLRGYRDSRPEAAPDDPFASVLAAVADLRRRVDEMAKHLGVPD